VQISANGISIEVDEAGAADAPPVLLIRGLGTQMIQWPGDFRRTLTDRGFRIVLFDNRDVGLSQKLAAAGRPDMGAVMRAIREGRPPDVPYTLFDMAADAIGVLDALEIGRAHVVGISMGGMIAQVLAARYAERVRSLVSIMSSSGHPDLPPPTPEAMQVLMSAPEDPTDRECVIRHTMKGRRVIGSPGYPQDDTSLRREVAAAYDRCYDPDGIARQMVAVISGGSRATLLAEIKAPTLVIHGADDPLVPVECGRDTAKRIPSARLEIIPGMGHEISPGLTATLGHLIADHAERTDA
jgi:pimeloyl-ACP methyl ester carboxylesterase